jgi:hypothetical protein
LETLGVYPYQADIGGEHHLFRGVVYSTIPIIAVDPDHSKAWNQGFSDGYLDKPAVEGSREYWFGFANGTTSFQYNKGFAEGSSNRTQEWRHVTDSYIRGYNDGKRGSDPKCQDDCWTAVLPAHTNDHYMQYYMISQWGISRRFCRIT